MVVGQIIDGIAVHVLKIQVHKGLGLGIDFSGGVCAARDVLEHLVALGEVRVGLILALRAVPGFFRHDGGAALEPVEHVVDGETAVGGAPVVPDEEICAQQLGMAQRSHVCQLSSAVEVGYVPSIEQVGVVEGILILHPAGYHVEVIPVGVDEVVPIVHHLLRGNGVVPVRRRCPKVALGTGNRLADALRHARVI